MTNLDTLKALEAAATPGPWTWDEERGRVVRVEGHDSVIRPEGNYVGGALSDINLVVALRNAFKALARELEAAREVVEWAVCVDTHCTCTANKVCSSCHMRTSIISYREATKE